MPGNKKTQPLIIANWKMKLTPAASAELARKVVKGGNKYKNVEVVICPGYAEIAGVGTIVKNSTIKLGAQNCFWEETGAFTGEVPPQTLQEYGVEYVIVGHSERRAYLGETDAMIHEKIKALFSMSMVPVLCIGESFNERQDGQKEVVLIRELHRALEGLWLNKLNRLVVAYEPIWVIGSGQAVSGDEAEHTHQVIKQALFDILPQPVVDEQVKIIYGGSVDPTNVGSFLAQPSIDGVLVGTASWDATQFSALIAATTRL